MTRTFYLVSVSLHILAAAAWIGGMTFLVFVIVPSLKKPAVAPHARLLLRELAFRFRTLGWRALGTLVVTGIVNVSCRGFGLSDWLGGAVLAGSWGTTLAHKLGLVVAILALSAVHDFYIGPRAANLADSDPDSPERERFRKLASYFGRLNFALALVVVVLAVTLVR